MTADCETLLFVRRALLLLIVEDRLRCRFGHFNLGAHLLDLRCLLFQARSESLNFPSVECEQINLLIRVPHLDNGAPGRRSGPH